MGANLYKYKQEINMNSNDLVGGIIEHYGIWGVILFMSVLLIMTIFVKTITDFEWIKKLFSRSKIYSDGLANHIFFKNTRNKLKYTIPSLNILPDKPITQQVFVDLLYLTVESMYYGCKNIINAPNLQNISAEEWSKLLRGEINSVLRSYKEKAINFKIPSQVIDTYSSWLDEYMLTLDENIELVASSSAFRNSVDRTHIFLLIVNVLLIALIGDIRRIAGEFHNHSELIDYRGNLLE